jgi:hypothetical protein
MIHFIQDYPNTKVPKLEANVAKVEDKVYNILLLST